MTCCGKAKSVLKKGKHIVKGFTALATGKKYEFTDGRIRICQKCEFNYWIKRTLWCSICKCFVPAKARVKDAECPKGLWPETKIAQDALK